MVTIEEVLAVLLFMFGFAGFWWLMLRICRGEYEW